MSPHVLALVRLAARAPVPSVSRHDAWHPDCAHRA